MKLLSFFSTLVFVLIPSAWAKQTPVDFNYQIRPILSDRCFLCHGFDSKHREADLRLDIPEGAFEKRKGGQPIVPGHPEKSIVWERIISTDPDFIMPTPESHLTLSSDEKKLIKRWIEEGANYQKHWSFVLPKRPQPPKVSDPSWVKNPIDQFILARLEKKELKPSPRAEKTTLTRRLSLDLIGLPPENLASPIEEQIDTLLASQHFGERWVLPWLDAARYADSNGFQRDNNRFAWPWRDYMIRALNDNKPQNDLIMELLAGDMLENPTESQILATAFNRHHTLNGEGGAIPKEILFNYVLDRVDTTATTFLGLTFACAQCHDHKYDPVSQEDYYRFFAFFSNMKEDAQPKVTVRSTAHAYKVSNPVLKLRRPEMERKLAEAKKGYDAAKKLINEQNKEIKTAQAEWIAALSEEQLKKLGNYLGGIARTIRKKQKLESYEKKAIRRHFIQKVAKNDEWLNAKKNLDAENKKLAVYEEKIPVVMVMKEKKTPARAKIRTRGSYDQPVGKDLHASLPVAFSDFPKDQNLNRLDLAKWIVSGDNPLTARVLVNRIWQEIFGTGIVKTSEDFGSQGSLPSHPELLDWLTMEYIESGWDFKHMVKLIVSSNTYQQSSKTNSILLERDPANILLARGSRFRLPSSLIRDQALSVSGLLEKNLFGPPVYPDQPDGLWKEASFGKFGYPKRGDAQNQHRRSLYTFWRRTATPPDMFDSANRVVCVVKPSRTNTPLQALTLLNNKTYVKAALALAKGSHSAEDPLTEIFFKVTKRKPAQREYEILSSAYERELSHYTNDLKSTHALTSSKEDNAPHIAALTVISQNILNLDETLTKE